MSEYIRSGSKIEGHYRKGKWVKTHRRKATIVNKESVKITVFIWKRTLVVLNINLFLMS